MPLIDLVLILIWSGFVFYGLFFGLIRTLGSLLAVIAGAWAASIFYLDLFNLIESWFFGLDNLGKIVCFIIVFTVANRLIGFIFMILDKTFSIFSIIPFMKTINRLGGAILGFLEGALVLGILVYLGVEYLSLNTWLPWGVKQSVVVPHLIDLIQFLVPFFSEALRSYL